MKKLRVLMFGWEFPPFNSGGLGVACQGIVRALIRKNVEVFFVLPKKMPVEEDFVKFYFADDEEYINIKYVESLIESPYQFVGKSGSIVNGQKSEKETFGLSLQQQVLLYEMNAEVIARKLDFDIIHAHDWLSFGAGIKAKEVSGKPLFVHIHATEFDRNGGLGVNEFIFNKELEGFQKADKIFAVSHYTKDVVSQNYNIDPTKIVTVHNGIDLTDINFERAKQSKLLEQMKKKGYGIVLFVGRLTLQKNPDALLHAAKLVLEHCPKSLFVFVGSGDMEQYLINTAAEMGISDKVIFTGFVRGAEKDELFKAADVFIMPSISEPFGLVSLESLAHSTPIIISKQSGVAYVLRSSLKVDFWDVNEIANKIVAVLNNRCLRKDLGKNGKKELKKFTWDEAADVMIRSFENYSS